ncbi:hypothetical protein [Nocardioides sp. cx-173]|uniref:hypothetical protein n=1 Tax=Nocardioides sp. cx-173 TaxID=2898796 RepID=UPI001E2F84A9|nr:hypothetical protein [Nocardioides sp. cx-173]MCD4527456.1 hypothetical protein [Nocardioides sp. cx-173]UGB40404.1 hypothetical protein LQ940_13560 [Nocardioides sp. cx-173]
MMKPDSLGAALTPTLADFVRWLENQPGLSDNQRRAAERTRDAYRRSLIDKMRRVYEDGASHNEREQETADRVLDKLSDLMDDAIERNRRGEIDGNELLAITAEVERDARRAEAMSEAAQAVEARGWDEVSLSPEQWQLQALNRFPALKQRLPRITDAVLEGRENPKF